jgi:hypothetical protein
MGFSERLFGPLRRLSRTTRAERSAMLLGAIGFGIVLLAIGRAVEPIFADLAAFGGHDWDEHSSHRALTVKALLGFRQWPFWMPYACGGFSEWANVQGAPNLVSPFLPAYLLLELRHALRVEVVGTALLSAVGTWLWAGTFTKSPAARAFACLVFVVNGRWALQAATGHTWHLYYALTPWTFYFFERATARKLGPIELRDLVLGGASVALMVYWGAIYPLPQTVLLLGLYAFARAVIGKSARPIAVGVWFGVIAFGLAAPKLLPILRDFSERPRPVASTEFIDLNAFVQLLVAPEQTAGSRPARVSQWGWHEYGMYIGWVPFLALMVTVALARGERQRALRYTGLAALLLGFGAFHEFAPWSLLHQVSIFKSQHVPTRWLYPAALLFGVVAAAVIELWLSRSRHRATLEGVLLLGCTLIALDISRESNRPMQSAFWMHPPVVQPVPAFYHEQQVPKFLQYSRRDYAPEALPALQANIGVVECTMHASLNIWAPKDDSGKIAALGAQGRGSPEYRGEAYTASGQGEAKLTYFSPNEVRVRVDGARPGDRLILNQNFDPGWSVNGHGAEAVDKALAAPITKTSEQFVFRFRPRGLIAGLIVFLIWIAGLTALGRYLRLRATASTLRP